MCSQHCGATVGPYVIASDGDEVHGVVHRLEDAQDGAQRLLQILRPLTVLAVFQHFLSGECKGKQSHTKIFLLLPQEQLTVPQIQTPGKV